MIDSFLKALAPKTPTKTYVTNYTSSKTLEKQNIKYRRYKLLSIILARATQRTLKDYWEVLWHPDRKTNKLLSKMATLCDKNVAYTLYLCFDRLKLNTAQNRSREKQLKNMINLLQRMQKYKLRQSFSRLQINVSRSNSNILNNYFQQRGNNATRKLHVLVKRRKKDTLNSIAAYARFIKSHTKLRVISVIFSRFHRTIKQQVLAKLHRYVNCSSSKTHINRQKQELKLQLQDITVQLVNKTESIQRLQEELSHLKVEQTNFSYREPTQKLKKPSSGSFKSYSHKKMALYESKKSVHNDSVDNLFPADTSIRSILGTLNRSRTGSVSNFDMSTNCNCGYMPRYIRYKYLNQSLKNQLQIVKEELGVAKDLNQHFTNEIKEYLSGGTNENEFQKLKMDHKRIVQQRDQLRQKLFKYQKHIATLKSEFKIKMEQLYRKVRKDM